mgnify:CR=1 FL=1
MKIKKTYSYALTEETLEKDIDKFIRDAKHCAYQYDYKYQQEGLKLIRAYFRMIEDELKKQNYTVARNCYKKIIFLLLQTEYDYFNYEDIVGKLNFEKYMENYFTCLLKTCSIEELFQEYYEYCKINEVYGFESVHKTIIALLPEDGLNAFATAVTSAAEKVGEEDYGLHNLIYFLLDLAKHRNNRESYNTLCQHYEKIVDIDPQEGFDEDA